MQRLMPAPLQDLGESIVLAEARAADLHDILIVLKMAIGFETVGLNAEERAGMETAIVHAWELSAKSLAAMTSAGNALTVAAKAMP